MKFFSDRHPPVLNHEKRWPMYQLRVVAFGVQKVILLPFAVRAPTWLDDTFWKFLIELIDMIYIYIMLSVILLL